MEQGARNMEWAALSAQLNEAKTELARVREALQTEFQQA
jgi:ribosomal protein L29